MAGDYIEGAKKQLLSMLMNGTLKPVGPVSIIMVPCVSVVALILGKPMVNTEKDLLMIRTAHRPVEEPVKRKGSLKPYMGSVWISKIIVR